MTFADTLARKLSAVSRVSTVTGVFVGMAGSLARVNVQDATVEIRCDGWTPPIPGMPVRVEVVNSIMRVTGPSRTLSPRGVVVESLSSGTRALVDVDGVEHDLPVMTGYAPVAGETVVINWQSGHVLGEEASPPETTDPGTIGGGGAAFSDLLVQPTASGKYDANWSNWWAPPEVWASNNNTGIWVYSGRFGALKGAQVSRVEFCFPTPIRAVGAAFLGLHAYPEIPGGAPTITDTVAVPVGDRSGWFECPTWWGNALRDNPSWGLGVTSGAGDNRWPGVGQAGGAQSGWVRFAGTRA